MTVCDPDRYQEARELCRALEVTGHPTMLAGGCVRDRLLGVVPKDYDLATTARPDTVMRLFTGRGIRVVPTGRDHGTVSVVTARQTVEVTTLRSDVACDGRHAEVVFGTDFAEDAKRRDFTINALFEDADGQIVDHVGGQQDLIAQRLRFVGDPRRRIHEDYLRILRYFRFLARFGWPTCTDQLAAIRDGIDGLPRLSIERVQSELTQITASPNAATTWMLMTRCGVAGALFPFLDEAVQEPLADLMGQTRDEALRWFSLFFWGGADPPDERVLRERLQRMRFTRDHRKTIEGMHRLLTAATLDTRLTHALGLHERGQVPARVLDDYLRACHRCMGLAVPPLLRRLLAGLTERPAPKLPHEPLMRRLPEERGEIVRLVKLYWYLGTVQREEELIDLFVHDQPYRNHLRRGSAPAPATVE